MCDPLGPVRIVVAQLVGERPEEQRAGRQEAFFVIEARGGAGQVGLGQLEPQLFDTRGVVGFGQKLEGRQVLDDQRVPADPARELGVAQDQESPGGGRQVARRPVGSVAWAKLASDAGRAVHGEGSELRRGEQRRARAGREDARVGGWTGVRADRVGGRHGSEARR